MTLKGRFKGKLCKARVRRDGTIQFRGKVYDSPSSAASAVAGHAKNGWRFWTYERGPGRWVGLSELRRR